MDRAIADAMILLVPLSSFKARCNAACSIASMSLAPVPSLMIQLNQPQKTAKTQMILSSDRFALKVCSENDTWIVRFSRNVGAAFEKHGRLLVAPQQQAVCANRQELWKWSCDLCRGPTYFLPRT